MAIGTIPGARLGSFRAGFGHSHRDEPTDDLLRIIVILGSYILARTLALVVGFVAKCSIAAPSVASNGPVQAEKALMIRIDRRCIKSCLRFRTVFR